MWAIFNESSDIPGLEWGLDCPKWGGVEYLERCGVTWDAECFFALDLTPGYEYDGGGWLTSCGLFENWVNSNIITYQVY